MVAFKLNQEQELARKMFRDFAQNEVKPLVREMDEAEAFDMELLGKMKRYGLLGIPYGKEYGGGGADVLTYALCMEEMSKVDASVGGNFALSNYDENDSATFYGKSAGVNDVRLGCTYKLKVGKANLPITSQMMWNPEANKGYFRVAINLLDI